MSGPSIRIRVGVILVRDGRILLVQHRKDGRKYWLIPGGGVRYGEGLGQAAKRELKEETNLDIALGPLALVCETLAPDGSRHILHLIFLGEIAGGDLRVGSEGRLNDIGFFKFGELDRLVIHPPLAPFLQEAADREFRGGAQFLGPLWVDA
jgi:ADP-ribose pyrophosphatase YjhB (NUDIX family)